MAESETTNVLLVDDLPEKHFAYRTVLEELGQNLVSVYSGQEALRQVLRADFAVILMDVQMPDMDGFETARLIRQRRSSAHTPIIFLTAFADEVKTAQGYATGGVDYIPTPVVPEILRAKVRVFVELHRMRQQVARQADLQARREAAEESARRFAYLAEASRALATSLDLQETLRTLARLCVSRLADSCLVTVADDHGGFGWTECAWTDSDGASIVPSADFKCGPSEDLAAMLTRAVNSGEFELRRDVSPPLAFFHADPATSTTAEVRAGSVLVLPLTARGRPLGTLALGSAPDGPGFPAADVTLAQEVANRAATALDNALLVRDIQENDHRRNEFLAMLAHELRNPLAPIRSAVHVMRLRSPDVPELHWAGDVIERQVTHLVRIVDDLLDVSRITRGKIGLQPVDMDAAAAIASAVETSRPVIEAHGHELSVSVPDRPIGLRADPARLSQVLANLLNNAAKYTPNGGRIRLTAESHAGEVVFRVRDNGMGIPREMLGKVFDLFTQVDTALDRTQGGLGIGLTMVRRIVELHGGSVRAESEGLGQGSEFAVRLPALSERTLESANGLKPAPHTAHRPRRILVVDDNVDAADSLARLLRMHGHEVVLAHTGAEAIETARSCSAEAILLDIGMPGMDGYEAARRFRADPATSEIPLIAVSGYGREDDRQSSMEAGFTHHLVKPVNYSELERLLSSVTAAQRP